MKRATQNMLYHLLPVVFWLLAIGGSAVPLFFSLEHLWGYIPAVLSLFCMMIITRIRRHAESIEECLQVSLLLGIASYWLPSVLFLIIPIWGYLIYRNLFSFRSILATLIGLAIVAIYAFLGIYLEWISNPWAEFFAIKNLWAWIPTGAILIAWLASTTAQQNLRVR